eukprot:8082061-Alexandrium_andersonii.AAC.1
MKDNLLEPLRGGYRPPGPPRPAPLARATSPRGCTRAEAMRAVFSQCGLEPGIAMVPGCKAERTHAELHKC